MAIIPVIDVLRGQVVQAIGGNRSQYQPLVSRLTDSTAPLVVAEAMLHALGRPSTLYWADLDAIQGLAESDFTAPLELARSGVTVLLDAGIRTESDLDRWPDEPNLWPVLGSETLAGPEVAGAAQVFAGRCVFSVDLKAGHLLGNWLTWAEFGVTGPTDAFGMAQAGQAVSGANTVLLLDLAAVGRGGGIWGGELCFRLRQHWGKHVRILAGGGVRTKADQTAWQTAGADAVLVATAVHSGEWPTLVD